MNCKPNQRCLVIGTPRGDEENIGAIITTVSYESGFRSDAGKPLTMWIWKDASRPLRSSAVLNSGALFVTHTSDGVIRWQDRLFDHGIFDHHLMPIEGDEIPEADAVVREETNEAGIPA